MKTTFQSGASQGRLASLDALRGFDMLMISGGGAFLSLMGGKTNIAFIDAVAAQFHHPDWNGFTFYDFIFPLFLFMAGTSLSFSLRSGLAKGISKADLAKKVFKRMLILFFFGILDKNAPLDIFDPAHIRYGTVLGRIGIATFIAALLYMNFSWKQMLFIANLGSRSEPKVRYGSGHPREERSPGPSRSRAPDRWLTSSWSAASPRCRPCICPCWLGRMSGRQEPRQMLPTSAGKSARPPAGVHSSPRHTVARSSRSPVPSRSTPAGAGAGPACAAGVSA